VLCPAGGHCGGGFGLNISLVDTSFGLQRMTFSYCRVEKGAIWRVNLAGLCFGFLLASLGSGSYLPMPLFPFWSFLDEKGMVGIIIFFPGIGGRAPAGF